MKNILEKIQQLYNRTNVRLKHLRGKHDQLDHAWNRGMGQGGGGVGLAPNQMGPLPTANFYRKRRIELMNQQRQGLMTRAEMRREMQQLRGVTLDALESNQNDELVLANRRGSPKPLPGQLAFDFGNFESKPTGNNISISDLIANFTRQRDSQRLPEGFNISEYRKYMHYVGSGISNVQLVDINGGIFFYRPTPVSWGIVHEFFTNGKTVWSFLRGSLKGLAADNIATAMGLPIAPTASITNEGFVITAEVDFAPQDYRRYSEDIKLEYMAIPTEENLNKLTTIFEPLAIMDLIIGQNDGHASNIALFENPNTDIYDAPYIYGSVDYDISGRINFRSDSIREWAKALTLKKPSDRILTPQMREILKEFKNNVQWHPSIPDAARKQYQARVDALLEIDKNTVMKDFYKKNQWGKKDDYMTQEHIIDSIWNKLNSISEKISNAEKSDFLLQNEKRFVDNQKHIYKLIQQLEQFIAITNRHNNFDAREIFLQNGIDIDDLHSYFQPELSQIVEIPNDFYDTWNPKSKIYEDFLDSKDDLQDKIDEKSQKIQLIQASLVYLNNQYKALEQELSDNNSLQEPENFVRLLLRETIKQQDSERDKYLNNMGPYIENGYAKPYYERPELKPHFLQMQKVIPHLIYLSSKNNTLAKLIDVFRDFGIKGNSHYFGPEFEKELFNFANEESLNSGLPSDHLEHFMRKAFRAITDDGIGR